MTKFKLFVGNNYEVQTMDGEVIFDSIRSIADADVLVDLLNDLSEENEQLKKENKLIKETLSSIVFDNKNVEIMTKGDDGMTEKEVTIDLNELNIDIRKEIIFKSDLNAWIERKMSYYEGMMEKTDGSNYVNAKGHLDMLIVLKEWIKQR